MEYSIDLQDIIDKNYFSLWNRYKPLQMKYWKKISEYIRHDLYDNGFEEFRQDCYIVLVNAANGVKVEKIKNPETYSFYVQYSQWLQNFTTRDIVRNYTHTYAVKYMDYDGEDFEFDCILAREDQHSNLWELVDMLEPKDRERCYRIAFGMQAGGKPLKKSVKEFLMKYYTEY
jgi:hypothetical protein